jgi:hypothetical protein
VPKEIPLIARRLGRGEQLRARYDAGAVMPGSEFEIELSWLERRS